MEQTTITQLFADETRCHPAAAALLAPDRRALTYGELRAQVAQGAARLRGLGIARGDRVAIVLPNGPEMALAFLCTAHVATAAPLNPAYRAAEFDFYLGDLDARALLVPAGSDSPAVQVASARGIAVLELTPRAGGAGGRVGTGGPSGWAARRRRPRAAR